MIATMSSQNTTYCRPRDIGQNDDPTEYYKQNKCVALPKKMTCGICLTDYGDGDRIATCKIQMMEQHSFHETCLRGWLASHIRCPCCRLPVERPLKIIMISQK